MRDNFFSACLDFPLFTITASFQRRWWRSSLHHVCANKNVLLLAKGKVSNYVLFLRNWKKRLSFYKPIIIPSTLVITKSSSQVGTPGVMYSLLRGNSKKSSGFSHFLVKPQMTVCGSTIYNPLSRIFLFRSLGSFFDRSLCGPGIMLVTPGRSVSIAAAFGSEIPHYSRSENYLEGEVSLREIEWKLTYNRRENRRKQ